MIKDRHQARHTLRDHRAGGVGLGVLETKRKHIKPRHATANDCSTEGAAAPKQAQGSYESDRICHPLPDTSENQAAEAFSLGHIAEQSGGGLNEQNQFFPTSQDLQVENIGTTYYNANMQLDEATAPDMSYPEEGSPGFSGIGNIYHDMTFDLFHFNVMGFMPQQVECPTESSHQLDSELTDSSDMATQQLPRPCGGLAHTGITISRDRQQTYSSSLILEPGSQSLDQSGMILDQSTYDVAEILLASSRSRTEETAPPTESVESPSIPQKSHFREPVRSNILDESQQLIARTHGDQYSSLSLKVEKKEEIVNLLAEMRPSRPDGTLITEDAPEMSLENLQTYLNLFLGFFNTSYPLLHVPTLDVNDTDATALLSYILLGATYTDKDSHQLSVCLYDAIVPYMLSELLSSPVPDLSILQAFLVLDCYGMYRAGPYQRESAILIHGLLLNVSTITSV